MRRPGRNVRRRLRAASRARLNDNGLLVAVVLSIFLCLTAALLVIAKPVTSFVQGCLVVGLAWLLKETWSLFTTDTQRLGGDAEAWTASALRRTMGKRWTVIHSIQFEGLDIDHVALSTSGVWAVETKYSSVERTHGIGGAVLRNATEQSYAAARKVRLFLHSNGIDVTVTPVLIVWGPLGRGLDCGIRNDLLILVGRLRDDWRSFVPSDGAVLTDEDVAVAAEALSAFADSREKYEKKHNDRLSA